MLGYSCGLAVKSSFDRFQGDDLILELQTALFSSLFDVSSCDDCPDRRTPKHRRWRCDAPFAFDRNGMAIAKSHGPNIVVSWPKCPIRWSRFRHIGPDRTRLDEVASWLAERGVHKKQMCPSHISRLVRHYLRSKEAPAVLEDARKREHRRLEELARKGTR